MRLQSRSPSWYVDLRRVGAQPFPSTRDADGFPSLTRARGRGPGRGPSIDTHRATRMMKTAVLLSTFRENVGDDLIRLGCEYLLSHVSPGPWRYEPWAKSNALGVGLPLGPLSTTTIHRRGRLAQAVLRRLERASLARFNPWRFRTLLSSDLVLLCGTPLFYFTRERDFADTENWPDILLQAARSGRVPPIVTLGCGSIVPQRVDELRVRHPAALDLAKNVVSIQSLVVCRDDSTRRLIRSAGIPERIPLPILPCPSAWAVDRLGIGAVPAASADRTICISFSLESTGWSEDGDRDEHVRIDLLSKALAAIERRGLRPVVLAHNELDVAAFDRLKRSRKGMEGLAARRVNAVELLGHLGVARGLLTWRVHGAVAARSLGIPALLFRTDSRADTAETFGATVVPNEASSAPAVESFLAACDERRPPLEQEALVSLKADAVERLRRLWAEHVEPSLAG